jgi:hypothetical protein
MAINIIEEIQKNLAYPPLQKVDPNVQEVKEKHQQSTTEKLSQAAIPAVLTAIYRFTRTDEGCEKIIKGANDEDWLCIIYKGKDEEAVEKVADYAGVKPGEANTYMENIADEAVKIIRTAAGTNPTPEKIKSYMNTQRHHILVYLPAALKFGDLLNDEGLDDRTNKMEGPVSNLMHKIENNMSGGGDR